MMRANLSARFLRVGAHLINIEAIQQVHLKSNNSAMLVLLGPKKSLQQIEVPAPAGRELWDFVSQNLVLVEFGPPIQDGKMSLNDTTPTKPAIKKLKKPKA